MRTTGTTSLLLASMASAASGISLSNFTPKVDGLPSTCNDVYNRQIVGCLASDFAQNTRCSPNCVNGLIEIQKAISGACKDVDVSETSIVGVFLAGNGIPALCRGVTVTTISSSGAAQTTPQQQQSSAPQQSSPPSSSQQSSTTQAAATSAANIPPAAGPPATSAAQPQQSPPSRPSSSPSAQSQKSNKDSGGGSPFDVQSTGGAADRHLATTSMGMAIGSIILLFAFI